MLKRIIFDIDNTLIKIPQMSNDIYQTVSDKYQVNKVGKELYQLIGQYEKYHKYEYFDKKELLNIINEHFHTNFPMEFLIECMDIYNHLDVELLDGVYDTLEYLSSKYELVCLTNWFTDCQKTRLDKGNILKFFSQVYGADIVPVKPSEQSYICALGKYKPSECMMVGDSLKSDIEVPSKLGIKVCYLSNEKNDKYLTINKISQLKEML